MSTQRNRLTKLESHQEFMETERVRNFEKIYAAIKTVNDNLLEHMLEEGGIIAEIKGEMFILKAIGVVIATALVGQLVLQMFK